MQDFSILPFLIFLAGVGFLILTGHHTSYIGSIEEVQTSGSTTQTTTYYAVGGKRVAADVNGTFYSFGYDALGNQVAVLNTTGSLVGAQLYGPYGSSRYSTGTLPTSIGFTGQRGESVTGLDYYNARYYDPSVGQFLSADSVQGNAQGMDPYAYVGGNPESKTDPTGQRVIECAPGDDCSGGNGGGHGPVKCVPGEDCSIGNGNGGSGNGGGSTTQPTPTPTPTPVQHQQLSPKGSRCYALCGGIKDGQRFAGGVANILIGTTVTILAAYGISNPEWAAIGIKFFLSWLGQGLSDLLYGLREVLTSFTQAPARPILFALDLVKLLVDVGTAVVNVLSIVDVLKGPGPGKSFFDKLGWMGKTIGTLFNGEAAPSAAIVTRAANLINSSYQLISDQAARGTIVGDWNNLSDDIA